MECNIVFTVFKAFVKDLDSKRRMLQEGTREDKNSVSYVSAGDRSEWPARDSLGVSSGLLPKQIIRAHTI